LHYDAAENLPDAFSREVKLVTPGSYGPTSYTSDYPPKQHDR